MEAPEGTKLSSSGDQPRLPLPGRTSDTYQLPQFCRDSDASRKNIPPPPIQHADIVPTRGKTAPEEALKRGKEGPEVVANRPREGTRKVNQSSHKSDNSLVVGFCQNTRPWSILCR